MALIMEHDDYNEHEVYESEDEEGGGRVGTNGEVTLVIFARISSC